MPPLERLLRGTDEFPPGASEWPADLDRREFLRLSAAIAAAAGLAGCSVPDKPIEPYVYMPEDMIPGVPRYYATAAVRHGFARGVVVETHEGRPTKIEGNPAHAESLGATDAVTQALVIALYDPDRSQTPRRGPDPLPWSEFQGEWLGQRARLLAARGRGWALLTEPTSSPTQLREIHRLLDQFPEARWYQHTALARWDADGAQEDFDPAQADVVLAIETDFVAEHPASIRFARGFARRRRVVDGRVDASRLYVLEAGWSLVGSLADARVPVAPSRLPLVLSAIADRVLGGALPRGLTASEADFAESAGRDLRERAPRILCIAGPEQPLAVRRWAWAMNRRLGAVGATVRFRAAVRSDGDRRCAGDLTALARAIDGREVDTLCCLGANPVYTGPADLDFGRRLRSVPFTVHLGEWDDETGELCRWHLPESDALESWSDLRGFDGSALIRQPMINRMYPTRSIEEVLRLLADGEEVSGYELVQATWKAAGASGDFESNWRRWLNRGVVDASVRGASGDSAPGPATTDADLHPAPGPKPPPRGEGSGGETVELLFRPEHFLGGDGRWANLGWLQELPRPFTTNVWDTALWIGTELGGRLGVERADLVEVEVDGRRIEAAVEILPGMADGCAVSFLGGGRWRSGYTGSRRGYNAFAVRPEGAPWLAAARIRRLGRTASLVSTQHHFSMEGRPQARWLPLAELPTAKAEGVPPQSLYAAWPRGRHAWAMSIDLSTCIGCSACVVACQAENNIPVVGKDQCARGREMHWIRVDRHVAGTGGASTRYINQPVPCMHCEDAPCELVCPVQATVHSSEGLNEMIYNRCVGTRYCSNNCPYKVRRFNFFDFRAPAQSPLHLQDNPNVTVRQRGVMERCSYCVQRIEAVRIVADREGRPIRDLEIKTACQQVCPVEAIVFGDLNDPNSRVSRRKAEPTEYALLGELNTRPRTTYLSRITNVPPEPRQEVRS